MTIRRQLTGIYFFAVSIAFVIGLGLGILIPDNKPPLPLPPDPPTDVRFEAPADSTMNYWYEMARLELGHEIPSDPTIEEVYRYAISLEIRLARLIDQVETGAGE